MTLVMAALDHVVITIDVDVIMIVFCTRIPRACNDKNRVGRVELLFDPSRASVRAPR
jgi:hypothetical protein